MPTLTTTPITYINPDIKPQLLYLIRNNFYYYCSCNKSIHTISSPITILSIYANKSSYLTSFYVIGKFYCERCLKEYYLFIPLIYDNISMGELHTAPASIHLITPTHALENLITFTHKHSPIISTLTNLPNLVITSNPVSYDISSLLASYLTYTYYKHLPTFNTTQYHLFYTLIASTHHVGETLYEATLFQTLTESEKETANLINEILNSSYVHPSSTKFLLHLFSLLPTHNTQFKPLTSLVSLDTLPI